jgi:hypothetical protein
MNTNVVLQHLEYDPQLKQRWSVEKANEWYAKTGWLIGCNYVPSTAINQLEMWQEETFDLPTIERELGWAADLGFNTVRVFLHNLLWQQDAEGFLNRIDAFLSAADSSKIKTMLVLFDGVWDPNPKLGKQPEPKFNVHNSGWVQSPGFDVLNDPSKYIDLHNYVHGVVSRFKNDERVVVWDLFNEPDNMNLASYKDDYYSQHKAELAMELAKKTINWVRAIDPAQPITMGPWQEMHDWTNESTMNTIDNFLFANSDVITFHCYGNKEKMELRIQQLKQYNRPMMVTEYMARAFDSTFEQILPLLKENNVGGYNWGFVQGKSQTHCPWDSWQMTYEQEPELWFHDIFRTDGMPYDWTEVETIKSHTMNKEIATEAVQKVA